MTTIQPAITPTAPPPTATPAGPVVVVPQPSPELARLDAGTALEVLVLAKERQATEDATAKAVRQELATKELAAKGADAKASTSQPEARAATVVVRTPVGDVKVRVPPQVEAQVDKGAKLALEILKSSGGQVTARITAIDGRPPIQALAQPLQAPALTTPLLPALKPLPPTPTLPVGAAWFVGKPVPLPQLQPLAAFVINAPTSTTPTQGAPGQLPPLLPGTELGIRVTQIALPGAMLAAGQVGTPTGAPVPGLQQVPGLAVPAAASPAMAPVSATPLVPGSTAPPGPIPAPTAQVPSATGVIAGTAPHAGQPAGIPTPGTTLGMTPGQAPGLTPAIELPSVLNLPRRGENMPLMPQPPTNVQPAPAIATVAGTVIASPTPEVPVVRTPVGDIQFSTRANLPVGTQVAFDVTVAVPPRADGAITLPAPTTGAALALSPAVGWPSLTEAVQILSRADPQAATQLTQAIPDGGPRTAASMMAFAHALRSGDSRAWPGDTALRNLERAGPRGAQLAAEISGEVRELSARVNEAGGEWRSLPMPWNADGKIDRIALITRREGEREDDERKNKGGRGGGTRFLINLELSNLGEMQFDGMFRRGAKSFDLMIRTKDALPQAMVRELPVIFANANSAMGLSGALSFQVVKKFPDPTQEKTSFDRTGVWA
ncbi:MAG: hypothetical protein FJX59_09055 [Alphaproteobacteria bacterium]|nr:hypothetical protein [Alphaproteobacteria bacterium]